MGLYKYSKRIYADGLLNLGSIRIGTLHDFRKMEHARGIADPTEGIKSIEIGLDKAIEIRDAADREAFRRFSGQTVGKLDLGDKVTLKGGQTSPDFFLLCLSSELSVNVQHEFDGTDACVEILESEPFLSEVTKV